MRSGAQHTYRRLLEPRSARPQTRGSVAECRILPDSQPTARRVQVTAQAMRHTPPARRNPRRKDLRPLLASAVTIGLCARRSAGIGVGSQALGSGLAISHRFLKGPAPFYFFVSRALAAYALGRPRRQPHEHHLH